MAEIFISYRRADSQAISDRIHEYLVDAFGDNQVFKDVDDIPIGADFRRVLDDRVASADVLLVIIGQMWARIAYDDGSPRLHDPNDFVRIEIESGLHREDIVVIPVLVNGAQMPAPGKLPQSLRELCYRNAVVVRNDPDFKNDIARFIHQLGNIVPPEKHKRKQQRPQAAPTVTPRRNLGVWMLAGFSILILIIALLMIIGTLAEDASSSGTQGDDTNTGIASTTNDDSVQVDNNDVGSEMVAEGSINILANDHNGDLAAHAAENFQTAGYVGDLNIDYVSDPESFAALCAGDVDIVFVSGWIDAENLQACEGFEDLAEYPLAMDVLVAVIPADGDDVESVTWGELDALFSANKFTWNEVNEAWTSAAIHRFIPNRNTGVFQFFIDEVAYSGVDSVLSADHLTEGDPMYALDDLRDTAHAIGIMTYVQYASDSEGLTVLALEGINPNPETIETGAYSLARPIVLYMRESTFDNNSAAANFVVTMMNSLVELVEDEGLLPVSSDFTGFNDMR
jgi:ABC-type phosphate transport system substrate-binding protein